MRLMAWLLCLGLSSQAFSLGNETVPNFTVAKRHMLEVFGHESRTIYCDCLYSNKAIDYGDCSFKPQKDLVRAARLEWEHVVPASQFGRTFKEWAVGHPRCVRKGRPYKGRKCAEKVNKVYQKISGDLYNLYPSVGEVNGLRENFVMGEIHGEERKYGRCDFEVHNATIEPRDDVKGEIARIYLYMSYSYPGRNISSKSLQMLLAKWDELDPVDEAECDRYVDIKEIQGNENPILRERCQAANFL